jgi:hypothetical protein
VARHNLRKIVFFHTISDKDDLYKKIVSLNEIYNFIVLSFFSFEAIKMVKKDNTRFWQHINRVQVIVALEKSYLSCMVSNGDTFCTKVAALNEIYNRSLR